MPFLHTFLGYKTSVLRWNCPWGTVAELGVLGHLVLSLELVALLTNKAKSGVWAGGFPPLAASSGPWAPGLGPTAVTPRGQTPLGVGGAGERRAGRLLPVLFPNKCCLAEHPWPPQH